MAGWKMPWPWTPTTMLHVYRVGTEQPLSVVYVGYFESRESVEEWVKAHGFSENAGHSAYNPTLRLWAHPAESPVDQWSDVRPVPAVGFSLDLMGNLCYDGKSLLHQVPRRIDPAAWDASEFATVAPYSMGRFARGAQLTAEASHPD